MTFCKIDGLSMISKNRRIIMVNIDRDIIYFIFLILKHETVLSST